MNTLFFSLKIIFLLVIVNGGNTDYSTILVRAQAQLQAFFIARKPNCTKAI